MLNRNVSLLALCQALGAAGASLVLLVAGIAGAQLAPTPALATLPIAISVIGLAVTTIPAAMLAKRIGRRRGFMLAASGAALAALLAAYSLSSENFYLLCAAIFLIGANNAFVQQYRFAAAESVAPEFVSRAVSFVLVGGIVAGILGPEVGRRGQNWLPFGEYTGSFVGLALFYVVVVILASFLQEIAVQEETGGGEERPLRSIAAQPVFLIAVLAALVGYGVMTFVMTATPVSMHVIDGYSLEQTARVIQSHVVAMFLPSLFTGIIMVRLGLLRVMGLGVLTLAGSIAVGLAGQELSNYWASLVLLGVGWNFLFVGGTVLLTRSYRPRERFKTQATNDFTVFGTQAIASLSAGTVIFLGSWEMLLWLTVPLLLVMGAALLLYYNVSRRQPLAA